MYLPRPYPDEIIGSVIERASVRYGLPTKRLGLLLYGRPRHSFSFGMVTNVQLMSSLLGMDCLTILTNHTVLPYVTSYMPVMERLRHFDKILNPSNSSFSVAALSQSATMGRVGRRICRRCVLQDVDSYGEAYWHRSHQLPGVFVCAEHGEFLRLVDLPFLGASRNTDFLDLMKNPSCRGIGRITFQVATFIANMSRRILIEPVTTARTGATDYRCFAAAHGYSLTDSNLASRKLSTDFQDFFGKKILKALGAELIETTREQWPALMLRERSVASAPAVKHILMTAFFAFSQGSDGTFGYSRPGKAPRNRHELDILAAEKIGYFLKAQKFTGQRIRVSELLELTGISQHYRHHPAAFGRTRSVIEEFKSTELAWRQRGRRMRKR